MLSTNPLIFPSPPLLLLLIYLICLLISFFELFNCRLSSGFTTAHLLIYCPLYSLWLIQLRIATWMLASMTIRLVMDLAAE